MSSIERFVNDVRSVALMVAHSRRLNTAFTSRNYR
jgi:tetrahydromethanopterin S-methyltransferase subunit F